MSPAHIMKISCERCSAQYDLDENRIPPSGMQMKCPACLHTFVVRRSGAQAGPPPMPAPPVAVAPPATAAPKKREIELSTFGDDEGPTPLPASAPGMIAPPPDEIDLPAPKDYSTADLPAPKAVSRVPTIAPPKPPTPPRVAMGPAKKPPPVPIEPEPTLDDSALSIARPTFGVGPDEIDLPAPVDVRGRDIIDLPAPKSSGAGPRLVSLDDDEVDLLAPKSRSPQVGISLDAPDADDLAGSSSAGGEAGPPALELDNIDVVAPREDRPELPTPRLETTDVAPRPEAVEVAFKGPSPTAPPARADKAPVAATPAVPAAAAAAAPAEERARRRWGRTVAASAGVLLLLGGVGLALGVFTGFGQKILHGDGGGASEQQLMTARKQMADDTLSSYRKAALGLQSLLETDPALSEATALAAQARLGAARLGLPSELRNADALLAKLTDEKSRELPDVQKARALRSAVGGQYADARMKLGALLVKAPADAAALVYLGWTELGAGDAAAADRAFGKALAAEATRAAALYGDGLAKERLGETTAAHDLYARALVRSPAHFGAAVGEARTGKQGSEAQAAVSELIDKRATTAAPKELADAWATVGALAAQAGRREEAEDRLKRALALDADQIDARVLLARVQCDLKRCAEAIAPLQKILATQPKELAARLALARAQLESGASADAATTLAPAVKEAPPKTPVAAEVLYWQGRLLLAAPKPDREQALQKFKEAVATNPKLIAAYVAESNTFGVLGQPDAAVQALQAAQAQASDDPELMTQLGEGYLALGKPVEAEARFRAVLDKKPEARAARIALGAALEAQNKLDEARAQYDQVASEDGKYPGVLERQARLAARQGRKAEAVKLFDEALKQGVPTQSLRLAAAALYLDPTVGRRDDARKLAEGILTEDERSAPAHLLLARVQFEAGHPEEALPEARRAATLADLPEAHLLLGRALESSAKLDQAINEYNMARRSPDSAVGGEAQLGRARILVRMGATKDALAELAALARDPRLRAPALLLAGDCYADLQQGDRARHAYEDAVRAAPESGDAAFKLGRAFHDAGRRHDAITQVERAVKLGGDKAPWAAEAQLLLGDAHREGHENEAAIRAYRRYLELAPADAPARAEVQKHISTLGGG